METTTSKVELLRMASTIVSPMEYFTDPSNTINQKSDIILVVENVRFYCHRLMLSIVSPVFTRMFDGEFREHNSPEIKLEGKTSESILELLKYIYPQYRLQSQVTNGNVESFLQLADEYMIDHLKQPCKDFLMQQLEIFKFVSLPSEYKVEKASIKSKHFHASDSALNTSQQHEDEIFTTTRHDRDRSARRLVPTARHQSAKGSSSYLKPGDKNGSGTNSHPRHILFLNHCQMPTFYDIHMKSLPFTNVEVELWFRRLRILYQIDRGRSYGEIIDATLAVLQFIPSSILAPLAHVTIETYPIDEMILNDISRARMFMLEAWTADGDPYRAVRLTDSFQILSPSALVNAAATALQFKTASTNTEEQSSTPDALTNFLDATGDFNVDLEVID